MILWGVLKEDIPMLIFSDFSMVLILSESVLICFLETGILFLLLRAFFLRLEIRPLDKFTPQNEQLMARSSSISIPHFGHFIAFPQIMEGNNLRIMIYTCRRFKKLFVISIVWIRLKNCIARIPRF